MMVAIAADLLLCCGQNQSCFVLVKRGAINKHHLCERSPNLPRLSGKWCKISQWLTISFPKVKKKYLNFCAKNGLINVDFGLATLWRNETFKVNFKQRVQGTLIFCTSLGVSFVKIVLRSRINAFLFWDSQLLNWCYYYCLNYNAKNRKRGQKVPYSFFISKFKPFAWYELSSDLHISNGWLLL